MNIAKLEPLLKILHRGKGYLVRIWNFLHGVLVRMGVAPKVATPLLIMLLAIFAFIVLVSLKPKTQASQGVERIWSVRALSVELADSQPDIVVFGEIFAAREVSFRALVAGEIIEVWPEFEQGALVKKDQKLLRIDPFYYERILIEAEASLRETKSLLRERNAKLKQANIGLERALKLRKKGTVAQKYVDDKATDVEIFQSRYDQTASVLVRRESSVARAERDFKNTLITAPFDGVLSNLNVREGRRVNVNERLANLTDLSRLDVRFNLSDRQYGGLLSMQEKLEGRKVKVYWRAGNETRIFDAVIERTGAKIGSTTRGIDVYARIISNEAFRLVRGGAFVEVRLPDRLYSNVTKIPQEALYDNQYVFIINEGRLEKRNVILEGKSGEEAFISGNLQNGELILISQFPAVGVGVRVEVVK